MACRKIVADIFHVMLGYFNLLDNVIVHGSTIAEHAERLHAVLERFMEHGVLLQPVKCLLGQTEIKFNGLLISGQDNRPLVSNVGVIMNAKKLQNFK